MHLLLLGVGLAFANATLTGDPGDAFGAAVAGGGDVNGDGYADVVVGASDYGAYTGRISVYLGSASGVAAAADLVIDGAAPDRYFGYSVAYAGDVDGDGYDDVIVGAFGYEEAVLYLGSASGLSATPAATLDSPVGADRFGYAVAGAGDVNGDGYDDVIVGTQVAANAYIYYGASTGLATFPDVMLGSVDGEGFGTAVGGAGDVNGDGYADVLVGAPYSGASDGQVYVYFGAADGLAGSPGAFLSGGVSGAAFGAALASAGDVNADGYGDVIVGGYVGGGAWVFLGATDGIGPTADAALAEGDPAALFGRSVSGAGDLNGDGYADVIVGQQAYDTGTGRAYVYQGWSGGLDPAAAGFVDGDDVSHALGNAVAGAGDVDGDGYADVLIAAYNADHGAGRVYVISGLMDGDGDGYAYPDDCDDTNPAVHPGAPESSCTDPVDYNCDGGAGVEDNDADGFTACRDCDDADPARHPGAAETGCTDPVDYNCDGAVGETDADGDGYAACAECDDRIAGINPGSQEHCNNIDDDCSGVVDDDALDAPTWFADADGDGYTDLSVAVTACEAPAGYLQGTDDDCDDADASVYPGATDVSEDGIDQDCDGADAVGDTGGGDTGPAADTGDKEPSGCGCASGGTRGVAWAGLLVAVATLGRRDRRRTG